jgi:hypothetical protein
MFHGVTGVVFDRGTVEGATQCAAVCSGKGRFLACVNGPGGGRVVSGALQRLPFDLIQEWGFSRPPLRDLGKVDGEPILHAVTNAARDGLVGITARHLFVCSVDSGKIEVVHELPGRGRIALAKARVYGQDGSSYLWEYDPESRRIRREAVRLPEGSWAKSHLSWARENRSGMLYTADASGTVFSFDEERGFSGPLGRTLLAPVGPCAVTHDGRLFGFCGAEMSKMFCYDPSRSQVSNLGVAVSVLERRRYGYSFGAAVTGRDGQIIFGEDDDLGHLWLYFPRIAAVEAKTS